MTEKYLDEMYILTGSEHSRTLVWLFLLHLHESPADDSYNDDDDDDDQTDTNADTGNNAARRSSAVRHTDGSGDVNSRS